jgi:hypothetical protein
VGADVSVSLNQKIMLEKITPELRHILIKALIDEEINLKAIGCRLVSIDDRPATEQEKEDWSDFKNLSNEAKVTIRQGLRRERIDLDKLVDVLFVGID